jgi:hypothetical protein
MKSVAAMWCLWQMERVIGEHGEAVREPTSAAVDCTERDRWRSRFADCHLHYDGSGCVAPELPNHGKAEQHSRGGRICSFPVMQSPGECANSACSSWTSTRATVHCDPTFGFAWQTDVNVRLFVNLRLGRWVCTVRTRWNHTFHFHGL